MKTYLLLVLALFLTISQINAQSEYTIEWQTALGGSNEDICRDVKVTSDNGAIFMGSTRSNDGDISNFNGIRDYWIVKTNSNGELEWESAYGGTDDDIGTSIEQTSDGGYIVTGTTISTDGDISNPKGGYDMWIIKLDAFGAIEWEKSYGGTSTDSATSIKELPDGGYIIAGQTSSSNGDVSFNNGSTDIWLVRIDVNGLIIWEKTYGGSEFDGSPIVQPTTDGGFVFCGSTRSNNGDVTGLNGQRDIWAVKTDQDGNIQWQHALGGSDNEAPLHIIQTSDTGYLIIGNTASYDGDVTHNYLGEDIWLVKLFPDGQIDWQNTYGSDGDDFGYQVSQTQDGNYLISGRTTTGGDVTGNNGDFDFWVATLDTTGEIIWQDSFGGSEADIYAEAQETLDGGIIVGGTTSSNDGDVTGYQGNEDFWILKLAGDTMGIDNLTAKEIILYPNPSNDLVTLENIPPNAAIKIIDLQGKEVYNFITSQDKVMISTNDFTNGVYFINIVSDNGKTENKKLIVNK